MSKQLDIYKKILLKDLTARSLVKLTDEEVKEIKQTMEHIVLNVIFLTLIHWKYKLFGNSKEILLKDLRLGSLVKLTDEEVKEIKRTMKYIDEQREKYKHTKMFIKHVELAKKNRIELAFNRQRWFNKAMLVNKVSMYHK